MEYCAAIENDVYKDLFNGKQDDYDVIFSEKASIRRYAMISTPSSKDKRKGKYLDGTISKCLQGLISKIMTNFYFLHYVFPHFLSFYFYVWGEKMSFSI